MEGDGSENPGSTPEGQPYGRAGLLEWKIFDHRREPRFPCKGEVQISIQPPGPVRLIRAQLMDISNQGFGVIYAGPAIDPGTQVSFQHKLFQGRALLMWSRQTGDGCQSGFMVVRE